MSSNIHSFRDINQNQQNNNEFRPVNFASSENENNSDENCCSYTAKILCPYFNIYTFTFFVTVLDVCMYFLTLILGYGGGLLKIRQETLDNFGMKVPFKVYRGQIHRLILYGILHSDFLHILFNVISQLSIGFNLERFIGHLKIILIYIISNICGGLFSCLITSSPSVGASVAICGLFGSYIAFTFINYYYLDTIIGRQNKYCNLIIMGFFVFIMCISAFNNNNIDILPKDLIDRINDINSLTTAFKS